MDASETSLLGEPRLHEIRQRLAVDGLALETGAGRPHDGAHVLRRRGARLGDALLDRPRHVVRRGGTGKVPLDDLRLALLFLGEVLATGGPESAVRLWDLRTETPFGAPLPALPGHGTAPVFSPDGTRLFVLTEGGVGYRWDARPASWARYACAVAGRTLTRAEWEEALPGRAYAPAC